MVGYLKGKITWKEKVPIAEFVQRLCFQCGRVWDRYAILGRARGPSSTATQAFKHSFCDSESGARRRRLIG